MIYNDLYTEENSNDFMILQMEYSNTELYKEVISFMNVAFPLWNTFEGIGNCAPQFILNTLQNLDYIDELNDKTLALIYEDISSNYIEILKFHQIDKNSRYLNMFTSFCFNNDLDTDEWSDYEYELKFQKYKKHLMSCITYAF
jgi:hypothetical protein